jgi:hypothetical protein
VTMGPIIEVTRQEEIYMRWLAILPSALIASGVLPPPT